MITLTPGFLQLFGLSAENSWSVSNLLAGSALRVVPPLRSYPFQKLGNQALYCSIFLEPFDANKIQNCLNTILDYDSKRTADDCCIIFVLHFYSILALKCQRQFMPIESKKTESTLEALSVKTNLLCAITALLIRFIHLLKDMFLNIVTNIVLWTFYCGIIGL